jgi:ATP-dependent RNA helicase DeaD
MPKGSFAGLGLPGELIAATSRLGFSAPTRIQAAAIPPLLAGRDVIGVARTGTGKTAAFGLPMLAGIDADRRAVQGLVLVPTRELAIQAADAITSFSTEGAPIRVLPVYGGTAYGPQLKALRDGTQVVVGTPGRIIDHLERGRLDLSELRFLVLDEADEMLQMGFAEEVDRILQATPSTRQTALFSATMPSGIRKLAARHLSEAVDISVSDQPTADLSQVRQQFVIVPPTLKRTALLRMLSANDGATVVFVKTRAAVEELGAALLASGVNVAAISGDVAQRERERIIESTRRGAIDVLVATDVAARGLDIPRVSLVVNYDLPTDTDTYVHRIGRTGRAGRSGRAVSLVTPKERGKLRQIEKRVGLKLSPLVLPGVDELRARKIGRVFDQALAVSETGVDKQLLAAARTALAETSPEVLAAALAGLLTGPISHHPNPDDAALDRFQAEPPKHEEHRDSRKSGDKKRRFDDRKPKRHSDGWKPRDGFERGSKKRHSDDWKSDKTRHSDRKHHKNPDWTDKPRRKETPSKHRHHK